MLIKVTPNGDKDIWINPSFIVMVRDCSDGSEIVFSEATERTTLFVVQSATAVAQLVYEGSFNL